MISEGWFEKSPKGKTCLEEMSLLFSYLESFKCLSNVSFDLSLARGLDYYTGMILEAVLEEGGELGSIAGGGRYDELIGMFSKEKIPATGASVGIERLFSLIEKKYKESKKIKCNKAEVLVATLGDGLVNEKMKLCSDLWSNDIKCDMLYKTKVKPQPQLSYALENEIPFILWIGENELKNGMINVKVNFIDIMIENLIHIISIVCI